MPWIIFAAAVWILAYFLVRPRELKKTWSAALWAVLVGFFYNQTFTGHGLYRFEGQLFPVEGIPLGYLIAFAGIGIILFHFLPERKLWQFFYVLLFSFLLTVGEWFALERGLLVYLNWSLSQGLVFKYLILAAILWLSDLTIERQRGYLFR